jgi:hypothetical protein
MRICPIGTLCAVVLAGSRAECYGGYAFPHQPVFDSSSPYEDSQIYCGVYCGYLVFSKWRAVTLDDVAKRIGFDGRGTSIGGLVEGAKSYGLHADVVYARASEMEHLPLPAIAYIPPRDDMGEMGHYVVFYAKRDNDLVVIDAPNSPYTVDVSIVDTVWRGPLVLVSDSRISLLGLRGYRMWAALKHGIWAVLLSAGAAVYAIVLLRFRWKGAPALGYVCGSVAIIVVLAFGFHAIVRYYQRPPMPRAQCKEPTFMFGERSPGKVEHRYRITNVGRQPLRILKVRTTCHCAATTAPKEIVQPGESLELPVVFTLTEPGWFVSSVFLTTDDPEEPTLQLSAVGRVTYHREIGAVPAAVVLGDIVEGRPARDNLQVIETRLSPSDTGIQYEVKVSLPIIQLRKLGGPSVLRAGATFTAMTEYEVSLQPLSSWPNVIAGKITFARWSQGKRVSLEIPVTAQMVKPIELIPNALCFVPNGERRKIVICSNRNHRAFRITGIEASGSDLGAAVANEGSAECVVSVSWNSPTGKSRNASVTLRTDVNEEAEVTLPVYWLNPCDLAVVAGYRKTGQHPDYGESGEEGSIAR